MGVSKNRGTPKSSILIGFFIINHPFWGTPIFGNTHIDNYYTNNPPVKQQVLSAEVVLCPGMWQYNVYRLSYCIIVYHTMPCRYMSCGRNYVHGQLAMSKLGGPLSVVKVLNFLSFHYLKWSRFQRLFHCDGVLISCQPWVACWPCVFSSLSWFCFAG